MNVLGSNGFCACRLLMGAPVWLAEMSELGPRGGFTHWVFRFSPGYASLPSRTAKITGLDRRGFYEEIDKKVHKPNRGPLQFCGLAT
jgi:hypothetical protein